MKGGASRRLVVIVTYVALLQRAASAQVPSSTAGGVAAFLLGDYQRAADTLGPVADRFPLHDDSTAEFAMALLYESGRGVPADRVRACALYTRASMDDANPLATGAIERAHALWSSLDRDEAELCLFLVNAGFRHSFQHATFDLGPAHWITVDPTAVIISQDGTEQRSELRLPTMSGAVYLPPAYTELSVTQPAPEQRHFIEITAWRPDSQGETWTLTWHLFEVIRTEWLPVAIASLGTMSATEPPITVDLHDMARVQIGAAGEAELLVTTGPDAGRRRLDSESERRERIARGRARDEAERRVDWEAVRDIHRPPVLTYADGNGCGRASLFGWSADRTEAISVRADQDLLQLSSTPQTFDLAAQRIGLEVTVHVFEQPLRHWPFCTDIVSQTPPETTWRAVAGDITIDLTEDPQDAEHVLHATAQISRAQFLSDEGSRAAQAGPIRLTAIVGWMSGFPHH